MRNPGLTPPQAFVDFARAAPRPPEMPTTLALATRYLAAYRKRALNLDDVSECFDVERMHKAIRKAHFEGARS